MIGLVLMICHREERRVGGLGHTLASASALQIIGIVLVLFGLSLVAVEVLVDWDVGGKQMGAGGCCSIYGRVMPWVVR